MKTFVIMFVALFASNVLAEKLACTTMFANVRTDKTPTDKICGAVSVVAKDNGIKYRRRARNCNKFEIEFMSIQKRDKAEFKKYCRRIFTETCYMVRIRDAESREGLSHLSAYMVFASVKTIPTIFNLNATGVGHKTGGLLRAGLGRYVRLNLSCRKSP